jgi:Fe-S-cluster containining protein
MPSDEDVEKNAESSPFSCTQCGECCIGYGGTFVTDQDIARISAYIGVDPDGFVEKFCSLSGGRAVLAQQDDGHCMFWDKGCTIHPVKPRMCRKWPYLESILIDFDNWTIMASMCRGINKKAPPQMVKAWVKKTNSFTDP